MATFGQMKQWVSKRLQDPDNTAVSSDDVGDLINMALEYWKNNRFWFNEFTDTSTLTQGDPSIPLPATWLVPSINDSFVIEYSGIRYPLRKISSTMYNAFYLSNGVGQPWYFAKIANDNYQVYPIPDRNYTIRRFWLADYDDFSADADTNEFSDNASRLLQYTAAAYGSRDFRQDLTMYQTFWDEAQREYQNLLDTTRKDNATGSITIYSMMNTY
jgi:hypothetical protein